MPAFESAGQKVGDVFGPWAAEIIVASHGVDGSNVEQLGEDVRVADVAGVDDEVTALERADGFGAKEIVSVGYQSGFHGPDVSGGSDCFRPEADARGGTQIGSTSIGLPVSRTQCGGSPGSDRRQGLTTSIDGNL